MTELPDMGFQAQPIASGSDAGSLLNACPFATTGQGDPSGQSGNSFSAGSSGPDISETLLQYTVSGAEGQMKQFADTANVCSSFPVNDNGVVLKIDIAREAFPSFGNDTVALRISADVISDHNLAIDTDLVAVRRGGTIILITNGGIPLDTVLTRTIVARSYAKLPARW